MLGRSDGVLNPQGIRFGSSEIYDVMATLNPAAVPTSPLNVVADSLVVGQKIAGGVDERVVLFVQLVEGETLGPELEKEIKLRVRTA
jgi:acetoacetyl-CoA synthetase